MDFNQQVIEEFRANGGQVGGYFEGARLLLLTTTGARSGEPHTTPVGYLPDGDRTLIIASAAGAPNHPAWYHNLVANPRVTIENGVFTYDADAEVITGAERDALFARAVEADSGWADYQAKTSRVLPVIALHTVESGPPNMNVSSPGEGLRAIHDAFRRELALVRKEIAESGPRLGAQLRVNCLTVCQGVGYHHRMEDNGMFPHFAEHNPELAPVLARLAEEHERVADLLAQLQQAISAEDVEPSAVVPEVDRLIEELETHLIYEEEHLIPILDATPAPA